MFRIAAHARRSPFAAPLRASAPPLRASATFIILVVVAAASLGACVSGGVPAATAWVAGSAVPLATAPVAPAAATTVPPLATAPATAPVTATPTPPNPLGPGLGLPSPGQPVPSPIVNQPPLMAPPLWLFGPDGRVFDFSYNRGTPTLVYFGYTHCPDVCPASLGVLRDAVAHASVPVKVVFVTVDPARDTPDVLKEYLSYFGQGWIGLTGTEPMIHQAADHYGARYQKLDYGSASGYAVGHTTDIYLIDRAGNWVITYPFGSTSQQIVDGILSLPPG